MIPLALNRLLLKFKQVVIPTLIFGENRNDCGGYYLEPKPREWLIGERFFDGKNGICIVTTAAQDDLAVAAHEFAHHLQFLRGVRYDGKTIDLAKEFTDPSTYEQKVAAFFTQSKCEEHALRFERYVSPNETNGLFFHLMMESK